MKRIRTEGIYWAGRLAAPEEIREDGLARSNCFVNKWNVIQFILKVTSRLPGEALKNDYVICYSNKVAYLGFTDNESLSEEERLAAFTAQLDRCLFGFTCERNQAGYNIAKNMDVILAENGSFQDKVYYAIPIIKSGEPVSPNGNVYQSVQELRESIIKREYIGFFNRYDVNAPENIPYILFYDAERLEYTVLGNFTSFKYDAAKGIKFDYDQLKEFSFEEEWYESVYAFLRYPNIAFVESDLHNNIILGKLDETEAVDTSKPEPAEELVQDNRISSEEENRQEWAFIEHFYAVARTDGLFYDKKDLINFHTAVKSSSLTILSGLSGTGKSRLVQCYAKALGLGDNGFYPISVRPSWSDDSDLIGFVDSMHMVYRPSDTGFINVLIEASLEKNQNKLYLICLDEMNLARVEHYFSQFLSILERPEKFRELDLYAAEYESRLYNSDKYPQKVHIGDNIRFIGTVNVDESTFHFSDKVLDRANVIKLKIVPYTSWNTSEASMKGVLTDQWTYTDYEHMVKQERDNPLTFRETEFLWKVHCLFRKAGTNLGVGPRILKQIGHYLINLPAIERPDNISRREGLDIQFVQRVLTKLRGQKEPLQDILDPESENSLYHLLDEYADISGFENAREALKDKDREIKDYGYTL